MRYNRMLKPIMMFWLLLFLSGCAGRPYLIVDYHVPESSHYLVGNTVQLVVKDLRQDGSIFTPAAAGEFMGFDNRYSLAWISEDGARRLAGEYDLENLFHQAFKKRLENLGVYVTQDRSIQAPVFEVVLQKFKIDLKNRKWFADVSYETHLSKDNQLIARERIYGSAERVKIVGRKGADTVLSEIFTDILNKVDIIKLFEQAKLAS